MLDRMHLFLFVRLKYWGWCDVDDLFDAFRYWLFFGCSMAWLIAVNKARRLSSS